MLLKVCRLIRCTQSPMHSPQPQTHGTSAHSGSRCVHKHALTSSANYTASRPPLLPRQARRERFVDTQAARCALSYRSVRWSRVIHAPPKVYNVSVRSRSRPRIRIGQAKAQQTSRSTTDQVNGTGAGGSNGWAWLFGSLTLSAGTGLPALYIGSHFDEIMQMAPAQRTAGIAAADVTFILSATLFLYCGDRFGIQRNGNTPRFPGPMIELDGKRRAPGFFQEYLIGIVLTTILAPLLGFGLLVKEGNTDLGLITLGVYLLCLFVQIGTESLTLRTGTPMWAQVPQAYQPYRLYQLARGLALTSALDSPAWLETLQGLLVIIWLFNYGAQMQFTPWIYRWHLQPSEAEQQ